MLEIAVGEMRFVARFEEDVAPQTVAGIPAHAPVAEPRHPRSLEREATWIPFGDLDVGIGAENATCYPAPGELLLYPGGVSETEILFPYGAASFASKAGPVGGQPLRDVVEGGGSCASLAGSCCGRAPRTSCSRRARRCRTAGSAPPQHLDRDRDVLVARQLVGRVAASPFSSRTKSIPVSYSG